MDTVRRGAEVCSYDSSVHMARGPCLATGRICEKFALLDFPFEWMIPSRMQIVENTPEIDCLPAALLLLSRWRKCDCMDGYTTLWREPSII